mmetsp:Transcript_22497/g.36244  ORF Transcript_22497/g.36244 Transcript_22497/m.36244 type:complete len:267 (-) Transcript_22497:54-854(-)
MSALRILKAFSRVMMSLLVASPKMTSSSVRPMSLSPRRCSSSLISAAMQVCTLSLACCSMKRGRLSTTFLMVPVDASFVSRELLLVVENCLAFSASELSTAAMCRCRSSTHIGSFSPSTASFFCKPVPVSMVYRYNPSGVTGSRSCTIASYVHSCTMGARGSTLRSRMSRSQEGLFGRTEPGLACSVSIARCTFAATKAAAPPTATEPSGALAAWYRITGNSRSAAMSVATRVAATWHSAANSGDADDAREAPPPPPPKMTSMTPG